MDKNNIVPKGIEIIEESESKNLENFVKVKEYYENIIEKDSLNYTALTNLGVIYQQKGELKSALEYFNKVVKLFPHNSRAHHNIGILNSVMGQIRGCCY